MKRRRSEPVQGSMLTLMGVRDESHPHAITKLVEDEQGNVTEMSHEPVPSDEEEDEQRWAAFGCPSIVKG